MIESIGKKLREAREGRNLTLEQVSQALRIRPYHLQALETDDYSAIPSAAQARGFLRNYAEFLGLNVEELVPAVRPQIAEPPPPSPTTPTMIPPAESEAKAGGLGGLISGLRGRLAGREQTAGATSSTEPAPQGPAQALPAEPKADEPAAETVAPAADKPRAKTKRAAGPGAVGQSREKKKTN
jgi:transcriptional regulator with XRE-family HTH domain